MMIAHVGGRVVVSCERRSATPSVTVVTGPPPEDYLLNRRMRVPPASVGVRPGREPGPSAARSFASSPGQQRAQRSHGESTLRHRLRASSCGCAEKLFMSRSSAFAMSADSRRSEHFR
jgi:hypothetical protein